MNILILNWRDIKHPLSGGAEISLFEQAKIWQKKGAKVIWYASSFDKAKKEETIDGIRFVRGGNHYTVSLSFFTSYLNGTFKDIDVIIDCFHFIPFFTPLYIHDKKIVALINEVAGKLWFSNINPLFAFIGYHLEPLFFKIYKKKKFITGSNSAKEDLIKMGISKDRINVVNHGVTIEKVSAYIKKENRKTLLFLGRLSHDKGFSDVVKAFSLIAKKDKDVQLWVAGKEEKKGIFEEIKNSIISDKRILDRIKYFGFVDQKVKFELLKQAWLLLHASYKEGWGLTVIEAGSQKTPTIGYNVEGLRDSIVDGKTGLLVIPNPEAMANGAESLLSNKDKLMTLSKGAYAWSKSFSWGKAGEESYRAITQNA